MGRIVMKQFNLEEYLKNPSKKIMTMDGGIITRFLCTDAKGDYPIVVLIKNNNCSNELARSYTKDGKFYRGTSCGYDLFFASEKHEGWVNVYKAGNTPHSDTCIWPTEEEAKKWANDDYVATVKIEWEE